MLKIYRYIKGYYYTHLYGENTERILNRALSRNVYIWDLKKKSENSVEFFVSKKGFSIIKELSDESNISFEAVQYFGLDKTLKQIKKRQIFFYAGITAVICMLVSSSFIWYIDVPDVSYVSKEEIKQTLYELGIKEGSLRKTIDYKKIVNTLRTKYENLIWADAELQGTRLKISLVPRTHAPQIVEKDVPCDIVAEKNGYITEIIAENGEKRVKPGDTVIKGQVLISGLVPSKTVGTRYVHSQGSVIARTWIEKEKEQKLYEYEKEYSGETYKVREIHLPFIKIPLYFKKNIDFYNYDSIIKEKHILFVTYREYCYSDYKLKKVPITVENAVKKAENELCDEIKNETDKINDIKTEYTQLDDETVKVRAVAESTEEIGEEREIERNQ